MRVSRGFSLLEVLVAFAFFALAGTALFGVFSGALRNASAAEDYTRAVLIAESRLASLGIATVLSPGTQSGEVEGDKYRWALEVRPYQQPQDGAGDGAGSAAALAPRLGVKLMEAEVVVSWPGPRGTSQQVTLTTLRLAPGE